MKLRSTWVVLALVGSLVAAGCGGSAGGKASEPAATAPGGSGSGAKGTPGAMEIKVDMTTSAESSWYQGAKRFKDLVEQRTNGKVTVSLHPNGELAGKSLTKAVQMVKSGEIDMSLASALIWSNEEPKVSAISLPWLVPNYNAADKFRTSPMAQALLDTLTSHDIVGLAWGENGFRQVTNSKHAIAKPEDLQGLQMRIPPVKLYTSTWKALGVDTKVIDWPDVPAKIKDGVIDGQENPIDLIVSAKLYEVQKYISTWNYSYDGIVFGFSKKSWDKFDPATQDIIRQAAKEAANYQVQLSRGTALSQVKFLKDKGMTVSELEPAAVDAFRAKVAAVYTEFESIYGKDLIDKLKALGA